ncbi:MAG: phosphoesterase [Acidobacteria bacterium]|nr:phosphoesterase [Acidobacteriota bacterium]
MRVRVLYHDHCFDGAASAAFFTRFYRDKFRPDAEFLYTGMAHKASQIFEDSLFDGDENAIVDFKYSPHPKLTWWFDHHQSAFLTAEDADHFRTHSSGRKMYDPAFRSCTKYISTITGERYGYRAPDLDELVEWAEIIDGAQYPNANAAVELKEPASRLTLVIEGSKGSGVVQSIIRWMCNNKLREIADKPDVQTLFQPLYQRHLRSIEIIRGRSTCQGGVVFFDLVGEDLDGHNKFIPYYLFPESVYTVSVSVSAFRTKVSVGSNPWAPQPLRHNLATICERYGGGGHPKVGAISLETHEVEQARQVAREITAELQS